MPVADHAVEMRAADEPNSTIVAITRDGKLYAGITPTEPGSLNSLTAETVYLKVDSRAEFQRVLAVLDALRGKSVVLLSAPLSNVPRNGIVPPYGTRLAVAR
jgi:biopolymer transport protein ExbD